MHKCSAQKKAKMEIVSGKSYGTLLGPLCAQIFEGGGGCRRVLRKEVWGQVSGRGRGV